MSPTLSSKDQSNRESWWREWFNNLYLDVYAHRDDNGADQEVRTTCSALPLLPRHRILDLCCGNGRHCRAFRRAGFENVFGIDYSYPLLKYAVAERPRASALRADMRLLPIRDSCCDAALSYFTSFGYFKTNVENISVLHELSRALKPGGWFLLDYLNPPHVRETFEPESTRAHGEYVIHERRFFSSDGERIEKEIRIENWGGKDRLYYESVRLYEYSDMLEMLQSADLHVLGALGSFDGHGYGPKSPRMILYGSRA